MKSFLTASLFLLGVLLTLPVFPAAAGDARDLMPLTYRLDNVGDKEYALYAGAFYRSYVDRKYHLTSFDQLKERAAALPAGTTIIWTPAKRSASGKPLLFGKEENVALFQAFCSDHRLHFDIEAAQRKAE